MGLDVLTRDVRYGMRTLRRTPVVAAVAVLSLALGIGATTTVFTLVNALLVQPLPVPNAAGLVRVGRTVDGSGFFGFSYPELAVLRQARSISELVGYMPNNLVLRVGDDAREEWMELVTPNYFGALGLRPALGRFFSPGSERESVGEIVISHRLWRRRFGGEASAVGRTVRVNGRPATVVGVAPPGFSGAFAGFDIGLWVPTGMMSVALPGEPPLTDPENRFLMLIGRIAPGRAAEHVRSELVSLVRATEPANRSPRIGVAIAPATGVHPAVQSGAGPFLGLLQSAVGLVLLIACANVAILLLVRGAARRREIAIRQCVGATRGDLVRQLLTESALLAVAGGAAGTVLAATLSRLLLFVRPAVGVPIHLDLGLDARVAAFAAVVSLGTVIVFGLVPAIRSSRADLASDVEAGGLRYPRGRFRGALVVIQVALSTVLLLGAALLARTLVNTRTLDPGFDASHTLVVSPEPGRLGYDETRTRALWGALTERLRQLPGVDAVTLALMTPLGPRADHLDVAPAERSDARRGYSYNYVSRGYFAALRIPMLSGRDFDARDTREAPPVAIVTEAMATRFWVGEPALGRRVVVADRAGRTREAQVVGVVRNSKYRSLGEAPRPVLYLPASQWYRPDMRVQVTTRGNPAAVRAAVRRVLRETDPDLPVTLTTLESELAFSLVPARLAGGVLAAAGGVGLLLAAMGLFAVTSYRVERGTRAIAIRIAVGAPRVAVVRTVLLAALGLTATGLVIGLGAGSVLGRALQSLLYGVGPNDSVSIAAIAALMLLTSLAACWGPAKRAARVDPMQVLRAE